MPEEYTKTGKIIEIGIGFYAVRVGFGTTGCTQYFHRDGKWKTGGVLKKGIDTALFSSRLGLRRALLKAAKGRKGRKEEKK